MTRHRIGLMLGMAAALVASVACLGQSGEVTASSADLLVAKFADQTKLAISISAVAVFSPSLVDARSQAERLLIILRGDGRDRPVGLVQEAAFLPDGIVSRGFETEREKALLGAAGNIQTFMRLAADAITSAGRARSLEAATFDLFRGYACLVAAWGLPVDGIAIPGIATLLRAFEIPVSA